MQMKIEPAEHCRGALSVPGDKSISHRAIILASLTEQEVEIEGFLDAEDPRSTLVCMQALGVKMEQQGTFVRVHGAGINGLKEPSTILDAGNSGTTARLLMGLLAGRPFYAVLTGDRSLRKRPMARVTGPLKKMGASIDGRENGRLLPLSIRGGDLASLTFHSPVASAQVKSAVLLAALQARGSTAITEPGVSRDHTERMLLHFGVPLQWGKQGEIILEGPVKSLTAEQVKVPGDVSSAAFFVVAGALAPAGELLIHEVGLNPTRTGLLHVLSRMGAQITLLNQRKYSGEPVGDILVRGGKRLVGVDVTAEMIPRLIDEIPVLAVAAAYARGTTRIQGAGELRVKESDRLHALSQELGKLGARIEEMPDGLSIQGSRAISGGSVSSHGDHRIAMALAVAGLFAEKETIIDGVESVQVSFPGFFDRLKEITC